MSVEAVQVRLIFRLAGETARFDGALGGVVSVLATVTLIAVEEALFPAASYAFDVSECVPSAVVVVLHDHE